MASGAALSYIADRVRVAITSAAFDGIASTMPLGNVGFKPEREPDGSRIWLDRRVVDRLNSMRRPHESFPARTPFGPAGWLLEVAGGNETSRTMMAAGTPSEAILQPERNAAKEGQRKPRAGRPTVLRGD
jgi:hypothetical protein